MKFLLFGLFILHATIAAPIEEDAALEIVNANAILPHIEEKVIEAVEGDDPKIIEVAVEKSEEIEENEEDKDKNAESAFFGMMNPMHMNPMIMGGMGGMNPMMMGGMGGMGGMPFGMNPMMNQQMMTPFMDPNMMGAMGQMGPMMDPMMFGMGGMGGMNPMMMDPMMMGMGGMGGMNPMMMGGMGGMGGMNPMMGGMGGMNPMMMDPMMQGMNQMMMNPMMMGMTGMSPINYMDSPADPNKLMAGFNEYKNEDFPTDYTLPCSNHCACEQVCAKVLLGPCNCRCPPKCVPGLI